MSELPAAVDRSIRKRRLFSPRQRILVAVSGGADSMVLLHVLHALAQCHGWRLAVAHLNHRLRGRSSEADERLVRRTAQQFNLPVVIERADVRKLARAEKLSIEMAARQLRHEFLARTARQRRIRCMAVAHHADDQLELFFLRLLRGSGGEGLGGMKWRGASPQDPGVELVRPLLDQPKAALVEYAVEQGIRYREDASNAALDFQRNRIRHELLPLLRRKYQPALDRTIARVMEIVGAEAEFVAEAAREWLKSKVQSPRPKVGQLTKASPNRHSSRRKEALIKRSQEDEMEPDQSLLKSAATAINVDFVRGLESKVKTRPGVGVGGGGQSGLPFEQLSVAVQRRCVQAQLVRAGVVPDFDLVEQLRLEADRQVDVGFSKPPGKPKETGEMPVLLYAVRDKAGLVHLRSGEAVEFNPASQEVGLEGRAGKVEFDGVTMGWSLLARGPVRRPRPTAGRELFDADKVGSPICLRHWRPGDRFQPIGMSRAVKLQDFFVNQRVPRGRRRQLIVAAAADGEVFWVEGMRISERFKLSKRTIRCLQWCWKRP